MFKVIISLILIAAAFNLEVNCVKFTRCGLVRELRKQGFAEDKMKDSIGRADRIPDGVCLIEHESSRDTGAVGPTNKNGSTDYGLFQINNFLWCSTPNVPGKNLCHVPCKELLANDITKACKCAKQIYEIQGFLAWYGWRNHCRKPGDLPDISDC